MPGALQGDDTLFQQPDAEPRPSGLAKYASQTIPAAVDLANQNAASSIEPGRKIERLSSNATQMRGYPAIAQEIRFVGGKEPVYMSKVTSVREVGAGRYRVLLALSARRRGATAICSSVRCRSRTFRCRGRFPSARC
jgi:hypothetical protein